MEKLMLEIPSPNVTKIIPLRNGQRFNWLKIPTNNYNITSHGKGIFEFSMNVEEYSTLSQIILRDFNNIFADYGQHVYNVNVTGFKDSNSNIPSSVGSERFCTMDSDMAEFLTKIVRGRAVVDIIQDENGNWMEMLNVSQYFRFMRYVKGGEHFPHYDSDFEYGYNGAITKYSLVAYFTHCHTGQFAFVDDKGTEFEGKIQDWTRQARDEEIYLKITPSPLKILVFPHTLCHTVLPFTDTYNERIICRGDILYKRVK